MNLIAIESTDGTPDHAPTESAGMGAASIVFGILGLVLSIYCGVKTWKKGHKLLFFVGLFVPILWYIGALMKPAAPDGPRLA